MRRIMFGLGVALAIALSAVSADAQVKLGGHAALMAGVDEVVLAGQGVGVPDGNFGLGARLMLDPPLFPLALVGSATYYFDSAADEASVWTATLAGQLRIPLPVVKPYLTGGWQLRPDDVTGNSQNGPMLGAGVQFDLSLSFFLEGTYEFADEIAPEDVSGLLEALDTNRFVIKGGVLFG